MILGLLVGGAFDYKHIEKNNLNLIGDGAINIAQASNRLWNYNF